jgi:hypothetical protein
VGGGAEQAEAAVPRSLDLQVVLVTDSVVILQWSQGPVSQRQAERGQHVSSGLGRPGRPNLDMPGSGPRTDHCLARAWIKRNSSQRKEQGSGIKHQSAVQ